jgi:dihydroorotate dehydrogenase electron transfer subunit
MKQSIFTILSNEPLTDSVYKMILAGDTGHITAAGQFVNLQLEGHFLRRPISVCDYDENTLTIIYKVVGKGTAAMSAMVPGQALDILTGLGNGYDLTLSGDHPVLLGGGVGVPPMYNLAKKLIGQGKKVSVILGFNTASEVFYEEEFKALGCSVTVTTVVSTAVVARIFAAVLSLSSHRMKGHKSLFRSKNRPRLVAVISKSIRRLNPCSFISRRRTRRPRLMA